MKPFTPMMPMSGVMMMSGASRIPATAASAEPIAQISMNV
jgi:hypothetical protein